MTPCIGPYSPVAASWRSRSRKATALSILGRLRQRPRLRPKWGMPFQHADIRSAAPVDRRTQCNTHTRDR
jgi:hypothetical protein